MKYKFLEHTADIKFKAFGKTLSEVFENSVLAVSQYLSRCGRIKASKKKSIKVSGKDIKSLFYNFLDELLYLLDAEGFITVRAKVKINDNNLSAEIHGDDASRHKNLNHIKAATYAEMYLKETESGWEAQAVLDV